MAEVISHGDVVLSHLTWHFGAEEKDFWGSERAGYEG